MPEWCELDGSGPARDLWIEILMISIMFFMLQSGPARDLWIEIFAASSIALRIASGPARDLWIEMINPAEYRPDPSSRVPQGTCGLK